MASEKGGSDWFSWALGIASGVGIWYYVRSKIQEKVTKPPPPKDLQTVAAPARYANLESVSLRLEQVKAAYRSGGMSATQAYAEANALAAAANSFSLQEGEAASEVYGRALTFQTDIEARA